MKTLKFNKIIGVAVLFCCLLVGCKEEMVNKPSGAGEIPRQVSDVRVKSKSGAAVITYAITDENVSYVLAEYEIRDGVKKEAKSSKYKNEIIIEGFAREGEYEVSLYSVNVHDKRSEPFLQKVVILRPPVMNAFESLHVEEGFGGVNIQLENLDENDLAIEVLSTDDKGELYTADTHYSSQKEIVFSARGFEAEERKFGVTIRDRWGNRSDTSFAIVTPLFEELIDRTKIIEVRLPTDKWQGHTWSGIAPRGIHFMFDGVTNNPDLVYHTIPNSGIPATFTIDLGKRIRVSRYKIWQRDRANEHWAAYNPNKWEIWGSNDPNPDGSWESWTLINDFTMVKPSGLPVGQNSNEDMEVLRAGHDFDFPTSTDSYRYLRFKVTETWGSAQHITIAQLRFWGAAAE